MAKHYKQTAYHPILLLMDKHKFDRTTVCKILNISYPTFNAFIEDSSNINLRHMRVLAGIFNLHIFEIVHLLNTGSKSIKKDDVWYIEDIKAKSDIIKE